MNKENILKNSILFMVGFCLYITIEVLFRGYSYPLMGVCGGLALVIIDKINDRISWNTDLSAQCVIGSLLVTFMELVIGLLSDFTPIPRMWDYSNIILNYRGIICVPFMLAWMLLSFVAVLLADAINYYVFEELPVPYYNLFGHRVITFKEKKCKL